MAVKYITEDEAVAQIMSVGKTLLAEDTTEHDAVYLIYARKLVRDVLDYCHRDDFPETLVFACADLFAKRAEDAASETKGLKSIKMDDTEFHFNVATAAAGALSDADFATIRSKLNLYRKVGGWG